MFLFCFDVFLATIIYACAHLYTQTAESNAVSFLPKFGLSLSGTAQREGLGGL